MSVCRYGKAATTTCGAAFKYTTNTQKAAQHRNKAQTHTHAHMASGIRVHTGAIVKI